jgi:hypothetical protein
LNNPSLPFDQNIFIRARGYYTTGISNGSGSVVESVRNAYLTLKSPAITSANSTTFVVGEVGTFTVTTTGSPIPEIEVDGDLPDGVTFTDNGDGTATMEGTPTVGSGGVYELTITASNGILPDAMQIFTLTVEEEIDMRSIYLPLLVRQSP